VERDKVPDGVTKEESNAMLQSLLEERFGLKVHRDTRTGHGFALAAGKNGSKPKPAEPPPDLQKHTEDAQKRMQENQESGTPLVGRSRANFPSITTEQLALHPVQFAEAPVVDKTGLTGRYSVTIETWKDADVPGGTVLDAVEKLAPSLRHFAIRCSSISEGTR
jgi:uncharacterized protein (TIGR03435 family)